MNYQIFISADYDCDFAEALSEKLQLRGYCAAFAKAGVADREDDYIQKIAQCSDVILLLTPGALYHGGMGNSLFALSCRQAHAQGKNIVPIITDSLANSFELPGQIACISRYQHPVKDTPVSRMNLDRYLNDICAKLVSKPVPIDYVRQSRELISLRIPLINPYRPAATYNPVLLHFDAYIDQCSVSSPEKMVWSDPDLKDFPNGYFSQKSSLHRQWIERNGALLEEVRERAIALKRHMSETGRFDTYYYSAAAFFACGHLQALPGDFKIRNPLDSIAVLCYCLDWPAAYADELLERFTPEAYQTFQKTLPLAFGTFHNLLSKRDLSPERRQLVEKYTMMLFDYMIHLAALLMQTVPDPSHKAWINQQIVCFYAYLRKCGLYLPENMQRFLQQNFK